MLICSWFKPAGGLLAEAMGFVNRRACNSMPSRTESGSLTRCLAVVPSGVHCDCVRETGEASPGDLLSNGGGGESVRDWLKTTLSAEDRRRVGNDIMTVEYGWPLGMPTCRHLEDGVHEVRTNL